MLNFNVLPARQNDLHKKEQFYEMKKNELLYDAASEMVMEQDPNEF